MKQKAFYTTRLSDGRKVELSEEQYVKHLKAAALKVFGLPIEIDASHRPTPNTKKMIREYLELGGHLEGK